MTLTAKEKEGVVRKLCKLKLSRDLDADLARDLGKDAQAARDGTRGRGMQKVILPISAVIASGEFTAERGEVLKVPLLQGLKAIATFEEGADGDGESIVDMLFEFSFSRDAVAFFSDNLRSQVTVQFTKAQLELSEAGRKESGVAGKVGRRRIQAGGAGAETET
ncbi:MAG: hypothetical protein GWN87_29440 [Desulfuromonadales bacterium]|nr:hypothetical protein [Desulfuromonadales bacterium]NIS43757.1 hypothetical protein [Desulfuromonadales bacterium]